jgi:hypothetical protein
MNPNPATHCWTSQAFIWNRGGSLHNPITLAFGMPAKSASHGQCQDWLRAQAIAEPPLTMATTASACLGSWSQ